MNWAPVLRSGLRGNAWGSATTAGTTTRVSSAGVGASFSAGTLSLTALADGGYQQYMVAPVEALVAAIPDTLSAAEAAPLLCAGVTTFNALRHSGASPGSLVAVLGVGGLGHLGIQFGNKLGYRVVAIGRGPENLVLAKKLGASLYIDSKAVNAAEEPQKLGGAHAILATAPDSKAMSGLIDRLAPAGKFIVVGLSSDPIAVTPLQLIAGERAIQGSVTGTPTDSEDTLNFAELTG